MDLVGPGVEGEEMVEGFQGVIGGGEKDFQRGDGGMGEGDGRHIRYGLSGLELQDQDGEAFRYRG